MSSLTSSLGALSRPSTRAGASRGRSRAALATRAKMAGDGDANAGRKKTGAPAPWGVPVWQRKNVRMWEVDIEAEFGRQEKREREANDVLLDLGPTRRGGAPDVPREQLWTRQLLGKISSLVGA